MIRRPPRSTRTDTLFPYTTLFRSFIMVRTLPKPMQAGAFALAIIGTALMLGHSYELSPRHFAGALFAILACFFYFLYLVVIARARKRLGPRSAERRGGKECCSTLSSRWSPIPHKQTHIYTQYN